MSEVACKDMDVNIFFPPPGGQELVAQAKAICNSCDYKHACFQYAMENRIQHGIWGGTTARERGRMRGRGRGAIVAIAPRDSGGT